MATVDALKFDDRAWPRLLRALAFARLGRFDDALEAANEAHAEAHDTCDTALGVLFNPWLMSAWMQAALELRRAHAAGTTPELTTSFDDARLRGMPFFPMSDRENLDAWLGVALARDETRRGARMKLTSVGITSVLGVLPALLYVVGDAARGAGDIEVWLDRVTATAAGASTRGTLLARAEAARWRGDDAAAAKLEARAQAISTIVVDDESAFLAKLLRL